MVPRRMGADPRSTPTANELAELVYELLDAHDDTTRLAAGDASNGDVRWRAHLAYLRDLQRVGREILAAHAGE